MNHSKMPQILIVEDELSSYILIEEVLEGSNCRLSHAKNSHETFNLLEKQQFDLILMDIKLPGMNGIELTKKIKAIHRHIPVLAVTAYSDLDTFADADRSVFEAYIVKPIVINNLLEHIKKYIDIKM